MTTGIALGLAFLTLLMAFVAGHIILEVIDAGRYLVEIVARNIKRRKDGTRFYAGIK